MNTESLKVVAINSFPANGNAGLKLVMSVLGTHVIPVPTLLLSGIGNMRGHERYPVPFKALLSSTLRLARENGQSLVIYVGYLGEASQAAIIADQLTRFADCIRLVIVDPVCGDNGRAYVPDDIIASWHQLLPLASLALPNITETALLAGLQPDSLPDPTLAVSAFRQRYPTLECIVTGIVAGDLIVNRWVQADQVTDFSQAYFSHYFSGTGDTFASLFIWFFAIKKLPKAQAIRQAGLHMEALIRRSIAAGSTDLLISPVEGDLFPVSTNG